MWIKDDHIETVRRFVPTAILSVVVWLFFDALDSLVGRHPTLVIALGVVVIIGIFLLIQAAFGKKGKVSLNDG